MGTIDLGLALRTCVLCIRLTHRLSLPFDRKTRPWSHPGFNVHTAIQVELVSLAIAELFLAGRDDILLDELRIAVARTYVMLRSLVQGSTISYLVEGVSFRQLGRFQILFLADAHRFGHPEPRVPYGQILMANVVTATPKGHPRRSTEQRPINRASLFPSVSVGDKIKPHWPGGHPGRCLLARRL
jgi:hypothetical protein